MKNRMKRVLDECIICGADFEEIRTTEPCEACKKKYLSVGVYIIETEEIDRDGKPILTATGNFAVVEDGLFKELFPDVDIPAHKAIMVQVGIVEGFCKNPHLQEQKWRVKTGNKYKGVNRIERRAVE
jgi:hypothetical protein